MTTNAQQLAALLDRAEASLMSAECHLTMSETLRDINTARSALAKAIALLSASNPPTTQSIPAPTR